MLVSLIGRIVRSPTTVDDIWSPRLVPCCGSPRIQTLYLGDNEDISVDARSATLPFSCPVLQDTVIMDIYTTRSLKDLRRDCR